MIDLFMTLLVLLALVGAIALRAPSYERSLRGLLWLALAEQLGATIALLVYARGFAGGADTISYGNIGARLAGFLDSSFSEAAPELLSMLFQQPSRFDPLTFSSASNTGSVFAISAWLIYFFRSPDYAVPLVVSGLSLFGRLGIFRACADACPEAPARPLFIWTVLFPSVAFWTSAITKEAFCLIGIGSLLYGWRCLYRSQWVRAAALVSIGATLILLFRAPAFPPLMLGVGVFTLLDRIRKTRGAEALLVGPVYGFVVVGVLALSVVILSRVAPSLAPDKLGESVAKQHAAWAPTQGGSTVGDSSDEIPQTPGAILLRAPIGLLNALLRPQLFDVHNIATLVSALEMTIITYFVGRTIRRRGRRIWRDIRQSPFLAMSLIITLVGCGLVGLVTLNLGSLARYRVPFLPFYGALLAVLAERTSPARGASPPLESPVRSSKSAAA